MSQKLLRIWLIIETLPPQQTHYEVDRYYTKAVAVKIMREMQKHNKKNRYVIVEAWE